MAKTTKTTPQQPVTLPETGYIRLTTLCKLIPFAKSTIWRKVKKGTFPAPFRLSQKVTAWRAEDIREWMKNKEAEQ
jgi:prophage regulatory protein